MNGSRWTSSLIGSIATVAVACSIFATLPANAQDSNFRDVSPSDPNAPYIAELKGQGILTGYGDGRFGPSETITREQFATLFVRALGLPMGTGSMPFGDSAESWSAPYIKTAFEYRIVNGTSATTFSPTQAIKREEAAQMVWNFMSKIGISAPDNAGKSSVADADSWAQTGVRNVTALGLSAQGITDPAQYRSQAEMQRGDAATLIDLAMKKIQQRKAAIRPQHVVIVVEENRKSSQIIGNGTAPYLNQLANSGAYFSNSHGVQHPSQPNYLALFSGSNQGVNDDSVPHSFTGPNLASSLLDAYLTFAGYSEDLPSVGFTGNWYKQYGRKHNPWADFTNVPASVNLPFTQFPSDFNLLPTVSFVIPNMTNDMHDGTVAQGDTWLHDHLDAYVQWAKSNNSLLIVTWDEDDFSPTNQIPTMFVGPMVRLGVYSEFINHLNVLRTIEDLYGLPHAGNSSSANPIYDIWK
ncbi:S-layer homology domain-containing protein [Tumebacillus sp. ITR2]|uniref:S-layer homology domain-containing protein n=1 Tax=Tumebacillus amylolyticus TaxID=2801339 RepID=A0ABS1JCT5_9BACL|nr:alkaline phosphatase family protein [Tumebacillus amylolyticus]MBL0388087.1 S-layer homology domain-containing protein [Tumebacillus amylolyticus]